ncbi:uncharacterized protein LOC107841616 [Capsicum annuum]|uniref:uncharacterized protein LOC107841616 n=1 Tax=Capsicum annuum TaxID=4072 RepID=UPI0007BEF7CA|nr:uncharacterized protein LOC107841616 [Capsicum annuum]
MSEGARAGVIIGVGEEGRAGLGVGEKERAGLGLGTKYGVSVYEPQVGLDGEEKNRFWEALDKVVRCVPSSEKIIVDGDFNGHIGVLSGGYGDVHRFYGFGDRNEERFVMPDFARAFGMVVVNSSFSKKEDNLVTS